jgi:hypothetical protein
VESAVASLKDGFVGVCDYAYLTGNEAEAGTFQYMEMLYKHHRLHSGFSNANTRRYQGCSSIKQLDRLRLILPPARIEG